MPGLPGPEADRESLAARVVGAPLVRAALRNPCTLRTAVAAGRQVRRN